jgi:hypothetical protein
VRDELYDVLEGNICVLKMKIIYWRAGKNGQPESNKQLSSRTTIICIAAAERTSQSDVARTTRIGKGKLHRCLCPRILEYAMVCITPSPMPNLLRAFKFSKNCKQNL